MRTFPLVTMLIKIRSSSKCNFLIKLIFKQYIVHIVLQDSINDNYDRFDDVHKCSYLLSVRLLIRSAREDPRQSILIYTHFSTLCRLSTSLTIQLHIMNLDNLHDGKYLVGIRYTSTKIPSG